MSKAFDSIGMISLRQDRKSTRLNSSHDQISYAVFCLKKKKKRVKPVAYQHWVGVVCPTTNPLIMFTLQPTCSHDVSPGAVIPLAQWTKVPDTRPPTRP